MKILYGLVLLTFAVIFQAACGGTAVSENAANFGRDSVFPTPQDENSSFEFSIREYVSAQNSKDAVKILSMTYPKLIEIEGGRESFQAKLNQTLGSAENYAFLAGKPIQTLKKDNLTLNLIPVSMKQKIGKDRQFSRAVIAAVTEDEGRHWSFADISDKEKRKQIFPEIADQMQIPEIKPPWIEK